MKSALQEKRQTSTGGSRYTVDVEKPFVSESKKKKGARILANIAQEYGFLVPKPCERCGAKADHKHHDDYDKPLEVTWLCVHCHIGLHVGERDQETEAVIGVLQRFLAEK